VSTESDSGDDWEHPPEEPGATNGRPPTVVVVAIALAALMALVNVAIGVNYVLQDPGNVFLGGLVVVLAVALLAAGALLWQAQPTVWLVMVALVAALFLFNGLVDMGPDSLRTLVIFLLFPCQYFLSKLPREYR
jgi:hypothetical protein